MTTRRAIAASAPRHLRGADRTEAVAAAALECFSDGGYRLTQIAHVSDRLGVSVGTIYRYVESKEALLYLAVLQALNQLSAIASLPVSVTGFDQAAAAIADQVAHDRFWPILRKAIRADAPADLNAQARAIGGELYDAISERAALILLLDRCAQDIPALAEVFDRRMRERLMSDLMSWVMRRRLAPPGGRVEAEALARGAMEAVAWLAKTRLRDRTASRIGEDHARAAAVRIFANAFYGQAAAT